MHKPISVIIPTYNRAHTLGKALDSILMQDYRPLEIIIIDDASTDNTQQFLRDYQIQYPDEQITWTILKNEKNLGIGRTRNCGLDVAQGEYIAFLDSDDEWIHAKKLTLQIKFLEKNKDHGLVATLTAINKISLPPHYLGKSNFEEFKKRALFWSPYSTSSLVIKKNIINCIGKFWPYKCEDYEYILRIGCVTKCAILNIVGDKVHAGDGDNYNYKIICFIFSLVIIFKYSFKYPNFFQGFLSRINRGYKYGYKYIQIIFSRILRP